MEKRQLVFGETILDYYLKGEAPALLFHSGTHGNETDVIQSVRRCLVSNEWCFPNFIWVPRVSPSAARRRTRANAWGLDVNRLFRENATDAEAVTNLTIMRKGPFQLFLSFHEDPERTSTWYLFDTDDCAKSAPIRALFAAAAGVGITPYSGPDGTADGAVVIRDGYFSEQWDGGGFTEQALAGQAPIYAVRNGIAKRAITLEIPGLAPQETKDKLVALVFQHLIQRRE